MASADQLAHITHAWSVPMAVVDPLALTDGLTPHVVLHEQDPDGYSKLQFGIGLMPASFRAGGNPPESTDYFDKVGEPTPEDALPEGIRHIVAIGAMGVIVAPRALDEMQRFWDENRVLAAYAPTSGNTGMAGITHIANPDQRRAIGDTGIHVTDHALVVASMRAVVCHTLHPYRGK
ncbi:MAG TPA: hypothetical protein VLF71_02615 [Candidatus Saccharimonadales bacterium]|nr:hypothetical protein [Candidatus Saccharimonadales bacterium]